MQTRLVLCLFVILILGCSTKDSADKKTQDVLAIVATDTIRTGDLMNLLEKQNRKKVDVQSDEVRQGLLNNLVQNRLIYFYGMESRLNEEPAVYQDKLTQKDEIYYDKMLKSHVYLPMISENDLRSFYEKLRLEVRVQQIVVGFKNSTKVFMVDKTETKRTRSEAKLLADSLYSVLTKDPQKFESITEEFSDDYESKYLKGDIGFIRWGMKPGIENTLFSSNVGVISSPQETDIGYIIFRITEKRGVDNLRPFEEAREGLREMMIPYLVREQRPKVEAVKQKFIDSLLTARGFDTDRKNCDLFLKVYQTIKTPADIANAFSDKEKGFFLASYKGGQILISELIHVMKGNNKKIKLDLEKLKDGLRNVAARRICSIVAREEGLALTMAEESALKTVESERMIGLAVQRLYDGLEYEEIDVVAYYETNKEEYRENGYINIAEIASMDEALMTETFQEIKSKNNFDAVYDRVSKSNKFICKTTGMVADDNSDFIRQKARKIPAGRFSELFTKVNKEIAVIKVLDRKQGAIPPYKRIHDQVKQDYINFKKQIAYNEWIANLSLKYKVQLFPERLKEVFDIKLK